MLKKGEPDRHEGNNNEIVDVINNCRHSHSRLGIVAGNIGLRGESSGPILSSIVVANRFPSWMWNMGGCTTWCKGVLLIEGGVLWESVVRGQFDGMKVWLGRVLEEVTGCDLLLSNGLLRRQVGKLELK